MLSLRQYRLIATGQRCSSSIYSAIFSSRKDLGAALGNDVSRLRAAIEPCKIALGAARQAGLTVIHTREGHWPDLSDAAPLKVARGDPALRIGAPGPMDRILIRGEPGHDIIAELYPAPGEPVVDKPGKGAFYQTDLDLILHNRCVDTLFVCGVTTEVCVNTTCARRTTVASAASCCPTVAPPISPSFHAAGMAMIKAQVGIFA